MGRYIDPVCRKCRRESIKLYLKGEKCFSAKCILEKKNYMPGMGRGSKLSPRTRKPSDYGTQLRAKQKVRHLYGVLEKQFRKYFKEAARQKGITGDLLISLLESRLDNVVFRMGFAQSRRAARQMVRHGHIRVNDRNVNIPSFNVNPGETITVKKPDLDIVKKAVETAKKRQTYDWLDVDLEKRVGKLISIPTKDAMEIDVQEQLIVELYSR
ncbi:MAG: 30S ribosomal protein S4 [Candidatus Lindowbacteria bacterium]|nr:30S ribosomal protein S4 [Candidatus Lindowbacteria bacterium]